jgi:hypothetical protein
MRYLTHVASSAYLAMDNTTASKSQGRTYGQWERAGIIRETAFITHLIRLSALSACSSEMDSILGIINNIYSSLQVLSSVSGSSDPCSTHSLRVAHTLSAKSARLFQKHLHGRKSQRFQAFRNIRKKPQSMNTTHGEAWTCPAARQSRHRMTVQDRCRALSGCVRSFDIFPGSWKTCCFRHSGCARQRKRTSPV